MKIVDKAEFYALPEGTLYSDYEPFIFSGLKIKQRTIYSEGKPIDFAYECLIGNVESDSSNQFFDILYKAKKENASFKLDFDCCERDGLYDENQMFAVYEKEDLDGLISKLNSIRSTCK